MANHIVEVAIRTKVSKYSDSYYEDTRRLGEIAHAAFSKGAGKAQIRNLENIANSASRVADILDFVKRQTGRQKPWLRKQFGPLLLEKLDTTLRAEAETIFSEVRSAMFAQHLGESEKLQDDDQRRIHILLCREFIRHLSAHYLYALVTDSSGPTGGGINGSTDSAEDL